MYNRGRISFIAGIAFQAAFFTLFFTATLPRMSGITGFSVCFSLGTLSLISSVYSFMNKYYWSALLIITSVMLLAFIFFIYFSVEGDGRSPLIFH
ncbi:hypothetical protein MM300_10505 [Evansella sp. LMS18]|uniref:hypothetical protein n=1 Tax=Evansella sp. LMS18 TaxID=2924033 RepID=UPI0020D1F0E1|nr:hypothetical protein [Evansella sp. LMS18]UTR12666.1 hypothetical protein MM300_10505 [Evansella sp. LMS18]